jgi:hypothetical protein
LSSSAFSQIEHRLNSFSGQPVDSRDWSQLCVEKDGNYLVQDADGDHPFVGCAKAGDAAAASCQRQCSQATSDCVAAIGGNPGRPSPCFDDNAACLSRGKGE